jgi:hypothetical protein
MGMTTRKLAPVKRVFVGSIVFACFVLALTMVTLDTGNQVVTEKSLLEGSDTPVPVRTILERACQNCHSDNTVWPWYSHVPLISHEIHSDVEKGRAFLDLSNWNNFTQADQRGFTAAIQAAVHDHLMPPPKYVWMHHEARLSSNDLELVKVWALQHKTAQKH